MLKRGQIEAGECLFIDDLEQNIDAARQLGIQTIRFVGVEDLTARLMQMGLLG
ncbi:MAG: HAD-IA family hydrolase [Candidatus Micrarchaeaceae archaeon]